MPPTAGSSTDSRPRFYYDLASPESYLVAERALHALGEVPEWIPVALEDSVAFRCAAEVDAYREDVERRAVLQGIQPLRWPEEFPPDAEWAMQVATFAKEIGRAVAFSLAAFRQAYAAGRDLSERDTVFIAGAAAEIHPTALAKGAELKGTAERLRVATAAAAEAGVIDVPAVRVGDRVFHGDAELELASR